MAQVNDDDVPNDVVVPSQSLTAETTSTQRQRLTGTQLPTLPFDLLPEILCRLPVKLLVQLRCLCKFFNSLISDPKFAKKHLQLSTTRHHLMVTSRNNLGEHVHFDSPITSIFSTSIITHTQLYPPNSITIGHNFLRVLCSCDGIFCGMLIVGSYFLWNPSIRKFKSLPPLEIARVGISLCSFGYDHFIDNYKVIIVSCKNQVSVNTLGNNYWTIIEDIPHSYRICGRGVFLSGTVNWFALSLNFERVIVSFDFEKESYQNLSKPDLVNYSPTLGVLKDCLCIFAIGDMCLDVWVMKEYGNKESWTKLYSVPYMEDLVFLTHSRALYISEDDQMLIEAYNRISSELKLVVYDSKNGTFNIPEIQSTNHTIRPNNHIYIESLISP